MSLTILIIFASIIGFTLTFFLFLCQLYFYSKQNKKESPDINPLTVDQINLKPAMDSICDLEQIQDAFNGFLNNEQVHLINNFRSRFSLPLKYLFVAGRLALLEDGRLEASKMLLKEIFSKTIGDD